MDNDKCRLLIRLYGSKPYLWNSKCTEYHNKFLRKDAWNEISVEMGLPVPELKKKMTTLLASYRREKSRINKSLVTGSGTSDIYVSKWFAYDDFDFMKDKDVPNLTIDTFEEDTQNENTNDDSGLETYTQSDNTANPANETGPNTQHPVDEVNNPNVKKRPNKKKKTKSEDEDMLQKAFDMLSETSSSISSSSSDQYFTYGQHIANELRKYDTRTLTYVKHAINNIIYEADIGLYSHYSQSGYYTQGYQNTINYAQSPRYSIYSTTPSPQPPTPSPQPPTPSPQPPTPSPQPPTPSPQPPTPSPQPPTPSPQPPTPSPQPPTPSPQPPTPSPQPPTPSPQPPTPSPQPPTPSPQPPTPSPQPPTPSPQPPTPSPQPPTPSPQPPTPSPQPSMPSPWFSIPPPPPPPPST